MGKDAPKPRPVCPRCGSTRLAIKSRTNLGDTPCDTVIRTEMLGCAVILKYCVCENCGHTLSRTEYESLQQNR
ncbi:MAG: hypothetical protein M0Q23_01745 [Syntrophales bacterium]|jgi:rRNA maturation endonuclease Nob1|nr:hypothetical protein [Syntrophales bacterium]MCK9527372.1 hypothetical protein [Syntrophales bacterium]MDX9921474.1 hypothetical protein [Syntrophales bacterium]